MSDGIKANIAEARELCGCMSCKGPMAIGAHTIAGNQPRTTPTSCVAATVLAWMLGRMQK